MTSSSEIYPTPTILYARRSKLLKKLKKYLVHAAVLFLKGIQTLALLRDKGLKRTAQTRQCKKRTRKTHMTSMLADSSVQKAEHRLGKHGFGPTKKKKWCEGGDNCSCIHVMCLLQVNQPRTYTLYICHEQSQRSKTKNKPTPTRRKTVPSIARCTSNENATYIYVNITTITW